MRRVRECLPLRYTRYPETPTLSVDADQERLICVGDAALPCRFGGTDGASVSDATLAGLNETSWAIASLVPSIVHTDDGCRTSPGPCPAIAALNYPKKQLDDSVKPPPLVAVNVLFPLSFMAALKDVLTIDGSADRADCHRCARFVVHNHGLVESTCAADARHLMHDDAHVRPHWSRALP